MDVLHQNNQNISLLIRNVEVDGMRRNIAIDGDHIVAVVDGDASSAPDSSNDSGGAGGGFVAKRIIDGTGLAAVPSLVNAHTHAAMVLMRGYADDMELYEWLEQMIWPLEAKLTADDHYWGTKLACLEMISNGITMFSDMYLDPISASKAIREMGMRSIQGISLFDFFDPNQTKQAIALAEELYPQIISQNDGYITPALAPHSIYTDSPQLLEWIADFAHRHDILVHIHLAETEREVRECIERFEMRPAFHLDKVGLLTPRTILAHCIHLDEDELELIAERGCAMVHNPAANMKLASGGVFPFRQGRRLGIPMLMGTDGTSSNNALDLLQDARVAAFLQKHASGDPRLMTAEEAFAMCGSNTYNFLGMYCGVIEAGAQADIMLVDMQRPEMTPNHHLISNLIYAASGSCVHTTICAGRVLMENRSVEGASEIIANAARCAADMVDR